MHFEAAGVLSDRGHGSADNTCGLSNIHQAILDDMTSSVLPDPSFAWVVAEGEEGVRLQRNNVGPLGGNPRTLVRLGGA